MVRESPAGRDGNEGFIVDQKAITSRLDRLRMARRGSVTCVLQVTIYGMGGRGTTLLDNVDVTVDRRANGALVLVDDSVRLLELAMMNFSAVASLRMLFLGCF